VSLADYYDQTIKIVTVTPPSQFSTGPFNESCSTAIAAVNPVRGVETFTGGKNEAFADYKAFMSSTVSVDESKVVTWDSKRLNVVFVKDTLDRGHHKLVFLKNDARQGALSTGAPLPP
jgi:hypothetical protein